MRMHKSAVIAATVAILGVLAPAAQAHAPSGEGRTAEAATPCGFHTTTGLYPNQAHYMHCTQEPYAVKVTVDYFVGNDGEICVQANADAFLGYVYEVANAYYNGRLC
ncbi:hypothetical protein GCM10010412_101090 [Nonomuraea recticatena]|uniref:Secreted protein n=2 Tax=Nonomuraea recticatena TaxID=46178 RepID=A0ABP6FVF4_9ACTN